MMQIVYESGPDCTCDCTPERPYHSMDCPWTKKVLRAQKAKARLGDLVDRLLGPRK